MTVGRRSFALGAAGLVLSLGAGAYAGARAGASWASGGPPDASPAGAGDANDPARDAGATLVVGAPVLRDTLVLPVEAAGEAVARRVALVAPASGWVRRVTVRESDAVAAGALLVELDTADQALVVAQAEAARRQSAATYRELTVFDDRIADSARRGERERAARAKSGIDAADVAVAKATLDLRRLRVGAPFGGRVADVEVVADQWVRAGDALASVVALDPVKVEVQVLESEVGVLGPGRRARLSFAAYPGELFDGRIETINPVIDPAMRTARVTLVVRNAAGRILPGMYARASLDGRRLAGRTLVPRGALLERDRRSMLFVFERESGGKGARGVGDAALGRAKWRYVSVGAANDSLVEVMPGAGSPPLAPGEIVLVDGHATLTHDARVRLAPPVGRSAKGEAGDGRPRLAGAAQHAR